MPGMETAAPERTDKSKGFRESENRNPVLSSIFLT
jgi:hypothetical protein